MAGMQYSYNFFPTDFYYPRPHTLPDERLTAGTTVISPVEDPKSEAIVNDKAGQLVQHSASKRNNMYHRSMSHVLSEYNKSQTSSAADALCCALSVYNQKPGVLN
ncbi:hypothetical protein TIFTF001_024599 [Ficus carica]|uniref:Uncharacterized protein n=1 Tax=Ficus carica TaxID=3494 RepID=A0AA88AQ44_FICCA|nr:hypothetical protein TIFTF001_024599 [Ficus carica]